MVWPPSFPVFKPTENQWSILKSKIYEVRCQYTSKQQLREAIPASTNERQAERQKLYMDLSSMDDRVSKVITKKGSYQYITICKYNFFTELPFIITSTW